ncbi:hypothetical protein V2J09_009495 [Rumex salicifolius]
MTRVQAQIGTANVRYQRKSNLWENKCRGLPHAHILIWLKENNKVKTGKDIDDFISAEIPDKETFPAAYKAVADHIYVVLYNRYLLLNYDAHINVEWCNSSRAIKYLFKYINNGPDRATVMVTETNEEGNSIGQGIKKFFDEIRHYLECRYLSACEAIWRIFGFDIHYSWPAVIRLAFHLQVQNQVTVPDNQSLTNVLENESAKQSMFTEWFNLNISDPEERMYVWNAKERMWTIRKNQKPIGRIVYCHPAGGERNSITVMNRRTYYTIDF